MSPLSEMTPLDWRRKGTHGGGGGCGHISPGIPSPCGIYIKYDWSRGVCMCVCTHVCVRNREFMICSALEMNHWGGQTSRGGPKEDMGGTVEKKKEGWRGVCECERVLTTPPL